MLEKLARKLRRVRLRARAAHVHPDARASPKLRILVHA